MYLVEAGSIAQELEQDEIVRERLIGWLSRRPSLGEVTASVVDGVAILSGHVTSQRDRVLAIELAFDAGADEVQDDLMLTWPLAA